jgi:hypothetical protein
MASGMARMPSLLLGEAADGADDRGQVTRDDQRSQPWPVHQREPSPGRPSAASSVAGLWYA